MTMLFLLIVEKMIFELEEEFSLMRERTCSLINSDKMKKNHFCEKIKHILPQRLKGLIKHIDSKSTERDDVSHFFYTLDCVWTFIDYELLQFIIKQWGTTELKIKMDAYVEKVNCFCEQTTIHDLITHWKPRINEDDFPDDLKKGVMRFSWDPMTTKVAELKSVQKFVQKACTQELAKAAYCVFYKVQSSSVTVTWLFWTEILPEISKNIKRMFNATQEFLSHNKVLSFYLDDVLLYSANVSTTILYHSIKF